MINSIQDYQKLQLQEKRVSLSISVRESLIVLADQKEAHLELKIINYPKFPLTYTQLKIEIEELISYLMKQFKQNRVVVEYLDETVMFEKSKELDPEINKYIKN